MCGIAGYFGTGNRTILERMTRALNYRGPDDEGFFVDKQVGLGHKRLSIIDLSPAGHQPMANEDGDIWVVFNGEIYNFQELRKTLKDPHHFAGQSDTEVIVHLYEEIGEKAFSKMEGMFALAIYDQRRQKMFIARDRMGKKPLYYGLFSNTLIFGSELKSVLEHPAAEKELDLHSLNMYLQYEYVPTPYSIYKNISKLEPGHYLNFDGKNIDKVKFWDIKFDNREGGRINFNDAIRELDVKLDEAVKKRLMSDVPLGIFLSGGIDSSTIAYYAQKNSNQKIKTFSIGFGEDSFDESGFARQVAGYLGTDHYEKILTAKDSIDLIPHITDLLDEPLADASILPTFLLSKFTREHVTVALGGDGGDELFCGYDTFVAHVLAGYYEKIPLAIRKNIIEKIALRLPTSFKNISFDFKAKKFISGFYGDKTYRNQRWLGSFDRDQRQQLFKPEIWQQLDQANEFQLIDDYLAGLPDKNYFNQLIYSYLKTYLMDDILVKVDRASMYNSLEVRAPLLDTELVDFVNLLPINFKINNFNTKFILKKMMVGKLPDNIINRKKKGFGIPLAFWINNDLKPLVLEVLSQDRIEQQGLFNYNYIKNILDDHFSQRADNRKLIWTLLMFSMWSEKWLKK